MLYLVCLLSVLAFTSGGQECTEGFMDYELLSVKASQIGDSTIDDTVNGLASSRYVIPSLNFTCSGTITGFLLAVDIRIDGGRNKYPWVALFNRVDSNTYSQVSDTRINIRLEPDDFSTSGLYNYTLSSPIQFTDGDIIGVYQPRTDDSVVTLQAQSLVGADIIRIETSGMITNIKSNGFNYFGSTLLLHPLSDYSSCLNSTGYVSLNDFRMNARLVTSVSGDYNIFSNNNMFFEDIKFTCNGSITNVIVGMEQQTSATLPPEIRIWRPDVEGTYTQSGPTIPLYYSDAVSDISTVYLRWYNLSVPISVKEGDVLGVYHPETDQESIIYYQQYSGPNNFYSSNGNNEVYDYNTYPLVSVIVVFGANDIPSNKIPITSGYSTTMVLTTSVSTALSVSRTATSNSVILTCILGSPLQSSTTSTNPSIIIPVTVTVSIITLLFICMIFAAMIVCIACYYLIKHEKEINTRKNDCDIPASTLNEAYGVTDSSHRHLSPQNTYDYIIVPRSSHNKESSTAQDSELNESLINVTLNDSYGVTQQHIYIEGKRQTPSESDTYSFPT